MTMERFFSLSHLTLEQLRELFSDGYEMGKLIIEYDRPFVQDYYEIVLPREEILKNICAKAHNYIVFHRDFEDMPNATTVAFPLTEHPNTTAYVEVDNTHLKELAEKYHLTEWWQMEGDKRVHYPFNMFYQTLVSASDTRDVN